MKDLLLCKPGEIFLKGLNKHYFEERLVANVKRRLKPIGHFRAQGVRHRDDHARGRL